MGTDENDLEELFAQLDFSEMGSKEGQDLWDMSVPELDLLVRQTNSKLAKRGELLVQTTAEGRDLMALRGNAKVIMENKKLGRTQDHSDG